MQPKQPVKQAKRPNISQGLQTNYLEGQLKLNLEGWVGLSQEKIAGGGETHRRSKKGLNNLAAEEIPGPNHNEFGFFPEEKD